MKLIDKDALVAEIEKGMTVLTKEKNQKGASKIDKLSLGGRIAELQEVKVFLDTLEVKEVDIDKLCEFRENIGFAYSEGVSEYQKHLACYRQGIEDVLKAQKGE